MKRRLQVVIQIRYTILDSQRDTFSAFSFSTHQHSDKRKGACRGCFDKCCVIRILTRNASDEWYLRIVVSTCPYSSTSTDDNIGRRWGLIGSSMVNILGEVSEMLTSCYSGRYETRTLFNGCLYNVLHWLSSPCFSFVAMRMLLPSVHRAG